MEAGSLLLKGKKGSDCYVLPYGIFIVSVQPNQPSTRHGSQQAVKHRWRLWQEA